MEAIAPTPSSLFHRPSSAGSFGLPVASAVHANDGGPGISRADTGAHSELSACEQPPPSMVYTTTPLTPRMRPSVRLAGSSTKATAVAASSLAQYLEHTGPLQQRSEAISAPSFQASMQSHFASTASHFPRWQTPAPKPAAVTGHSLAPVIFKGAKVTNHTSAASVAQSTYQPLGRSAGLVTVMRATTAVPAVVNFPATTVGSVPHFRVSTPCSQPLPSVTYQKPVGLDWMATVNEKEKSVNMGDSNLMGNTSDLMEESGAVLSRQLCVEAIDTATTDVGLGRRAWCWC